MQDPVVATVFVPGATAKLAGLHAVGNLRITIPVPPVPPQLPDPGPFP